MLASFICQLCQQYKDPPKVKQHPLILKADIEFSNNRFRIWILNITLLDTCIAHVLITFRTHTIS